MLRGSGNAYLIAANFTALSAVCSFRHRPSFDILASIPREVSCCGDGSLYESRGGGDNSPVIQLNLWGKLYTKGLDKEWHDTDKVIKCWQQSLSLPLHLPPDQSNACTLSHGLI